MRAILLQNAHSLRIMGSGVLDLCYIACGRLDACYSGVAGEGMKPWDYAAGSLFINEANGYLCDIHGKPFHIFTSGFVAASTPELANQIVDTIKTCIE